MNLRFHIDPSLKPIEGEIRSVLELLNYKNKIELTPTAEDAVTIGPDPHHHLTLSKAFTSRSLTRLKLRENLILESEGKPDWIGSVFYMVNSLQEYDPSRRDSLGRFPFKSSYQFTFNVTGKNLVQNYLDEILRIANLPGRKEPTAFFLSHDIDTVYRAWLEDGFYALRKGRIDILLKLLLNAATLRPDWLNIDKIIKLESEYDVRSAFFWIVNKGRIDRRLSNSDYTFSGKRIQKQLDLVEASGFENGIHKSISDESFKSELQKFGRRPQANRYHFLKFSLPEGYRLIESSHLAVDASLGFAESIGFRNSYGLPFRPYDYERQQPFSFIEVPLHIMDATYYTYKKWDPVKAQQEVIDFFEQNKWNCLLSVLWHNNYFTNYKYKGYLKFYKGLLAYIRENRFETVLSHDIMSRYDTPQLA